MACIIRLLVTAIGVPTEFDGKFVQKYDPTVKRADGSYDGGILIVTTNPAEAMRFPDAGAAFKKWRQACGWREDGEWNRPLTAWSISVEEVSDAKHSDADRSPEPRSV